MTTMTQASKGAVPAVKVTAEVSPGTWCNFRFDKPFKIGRLKDCELFIDSPFVSRVHAAVVFENGHWTIRDLGSANGLFSRGAQVPFVLVDGLTVVRLGIEGPEVKLEVEKPLPEPPPHKTLRVKDHTADRHIDRYIDHYFGKAAAGEPAGEHTMFIRQAYAHVEKKQKKKFGVVVAGLVALILAAGLLA